MDFDARLAVEICGHNAADAAMRRTNLAREEAEAVLAAGGSPEHGAPPEPARLPSDKELKEAMDAVLAHDEP